ncbi:DNA-3-methyladenine glycosylase family protein [Halococcus agarilyticus]|uniref:DNA-3-methyladenine glycosylase family protein n=1 Tax=Halococcus agarilyticus TaxID=1232219 RepID=UPI000677D996|nr:DNA glycosylase [Halococcus agarilyticus]
MESGTIDLDDLAGGIDLQATLESGQSFCWSREDGGSYERSAVSGGSAWYTTVLPTDFTGEREVVRVRQADGRLEWEATTDAVAPLTHLLRLDDDLDALQAAAPDDPLIDAALDAYRGLRIVRDPPFATLIAFICSAQMRVGRIHGMQRALAREFGSVVDFDGETYHAFPTPEELAAASEADLRACSLGYRAPYVERTAELVASDEVRPEDARGKEYEAAREYLKQFVGVGDKVADCVLLFSLGYLEAVPLDTWIQTAIAEHFPDCDRGSYAETSRAIRREFGGEHAGYVQTHVFHYLRGGGDAPNGD